MAFLFKEVSQVSANESNSYCLLTVGTDAALRESEPLILWQKKKMRNMKVTVLPIIIRAFGIVPKTFVKKQLVFEIHGRIETTQSIVLLNLSKIGECWTAVNLMSNESHEIHNVKN